MNYAIDTLFFLQFVDEDTVVQSQDNAFQILLCYLMNARREVGKNEPYAYQNY